MTHFISLSHSPFSYLHSGRALTIRRRLPDHCPITLLEHVEVYVKMTHTRRGHVKMTLRHGRMMSTLLPGRLQDVYESTLDWTVLSVQFWGENPQSPSDWILEISNAFRNRRGARGK